MWHVTGEGARCQIVDRPPRGHNAAHADFDQGWANTPAEYVPFPKITYPQDPTGPDALIEAHWLWPTHKLVPFHMVHPVTGKAIVAERWQGDIDRERAARDAVSA